MNQQDAAGAKAELIKLQVTYKEVLLRDQADAAKGQRVMKNLAKQHEELRAQLDEERKGNDKNGTRVKEFEETIEAVERSLEWMKDQRAA